MLMPVNSEKVGKIEAYKPSKKEKEYLLNLNERIQHLKDHRKKIMANPYDLSKEARTIEETWDFADLVALPHKYSHVELKSWMAKNSRPLTYAKIDTAISILFEKNPEIEVSAKQESFEPKTKLIQALYALSWDKGNGQQQLIRFLHDIAKYGFAVGREYHRYEEQEIDEVIDYDPVENKHLTEKKKITKHDEAYFEVLPIRDCWFDDRARAYDEDSVRDWCWEVTYDYSTFKNKFDKYPNSKYVQPNYSASNKDTTDKANVADDSGYGPKVRLTFYESVEDNEFAVTDGNVLVFKAPLVNSELSCVWGLWRFRSAFTVYGIGLPEILENDQELLDRVANMTVNQVILSITKGGFYGGSGTITERDATLEPKIKKLRDVDKLVFPDIPVPNQTVFAMIEDIRNEADEMSGVTKSLMGEQVGKTLGEAVLNREAGLRRLALPLKNIEFALERHAKLRINNLQRIYSRPAKAVVVRDTLGQILDPKLWEEYNATKASKGENDIDFIQRFPADDVTGVVYRNQFKKERLPVEKTDKGEVEFSENDQLFEVAPAEIRGDYDVRVRATSMIPLSQALEESKALETYNIIAQNPYTDLYKATSRLLKKRNEKPDDWLQSKEEIIEKQQSAMAAQEQGMLPDEGAPMEGMQGAETVVPPNQLEQPAAGPGLSQQVSNALT